MGRTGAFGAFAAAAAEPSKHGNFSSSREVTLTSLQNGKNSKNGAAAPRPVPTLSLEEVRALLEELRTVSSSAKFQKDLQHLRSLDWGAFKKREAVAKLLSIFWKAPLRRFGFGIDGQGFPHLLQVVKAHGQRPGIRLVSHEVEKQLRMVPGTLFGLTADVKNWKDDAQGKSNGKTNATVSNGKVPTDLRGRTMFLGEAKEILKAFREALLSPTVMRTMQNIEQKGGVHMDQHRRVLITQEWNPILKRFDFPPTEAGYEAMKTGIRQFAENEYVRSCCHEVEGLCGAPPGSYFGVPTIEEMEARAEEKRKAEEEAAKRIEAEKRQAEEEARKRKEEEESRRKQEEEARQKREEEEAKRRQEEEEAREKKRKEEEEEAKRREEEEEATRRKQEEETQRKEEEETKMNEEEARQRKKEEEVTAEKEKEAQRSVEDAMTANVAVDKEGEEPASQLSRRDEEEGKCPQPDQEGQSHEQADINKSPEELNDSSGSQVGANLCNSLEDPERQRQIEEEKSIVNGDAKLEADREAAAKRSSEGVTGTADTAGQAGEAASPSINDAENGTLNGHAAAKNQVEEEPRENVSTHQALRPLPVLRAPDSGSEALGVVLREAVVQGVAEGPWLRLLPCSCRTLGVLGDRGYLPLEELQPVTSVTSVTWSCPLPMGAAGRFKVRAKHVAVRAHPELRGKVVGVVVAGRMLMGTPHKVAGYLWLRFEESSRKKVGDKEAWALVQDLGGDVLLEPLDADGRRALSNFQGSQAQAADPQTAGSDKVGATAVPPAPTVEKLPTPVTDPVKVSQRVEAAALARKQLKGPLEFRVLAEDHSAPVRKEPLVQSPQLGKLERGELVYGYPGGGWLQLMHSELENSWVFIGTRLSAVWAELRVTARSWNALEVTWPGLHEEKRVAYNVEWRTPEGAAKQMKGHKVSASNKVVLGNLPSGLLCFRVGARVAGAGNNDDQDVKLWGPWAELVAGED